MVIAQGDVFWLRFGGEGSEPSGRRPAVVIQDDRFNRSAIQTTIVAAITSNLRLTAMPGNVRLRAGEGRLPRACVVNVSLVRTVDRSRLVERIGTLGRPRMEEILAGMSLVLGIDRIGNE